MCPVNTVDVYRSLMPFYMWPISHSQYTRGVLDQIMKEGCVRGTTIRKRILSEQDMGLKPSETKYVWKRDGRRMEGGVEGGRKGEAGRGGREGGGRENMGGRG